MKPKNKACVTTCASMRCKSACFGLQKCLFQELKQWVLACKTMGFAKRFLKDDCVEIKNTDMKRLIIIPIAALFAAMTLIVSCSDYDEGRGLQTETFSFNGTVLDFLAHAEDYTDQTFDSLRLIVDNTPGLRGKLSEQNTDYTLFLASDSSFAKALRTLNRYRRGNGLGRDLAIRDLLIEPFSVTDTIIPGTGQVVDGEYVADTVFTVRQYDYRGSLDTLTCRYAFKQAITSIDANDEIYTSLAVRQMKVLSGRNDASGMTGAGTPYMQLVDMQSSMRQDLWVKAAVSRWDIKCTNGYVHILSENHEFAFNNFTSYFGNYGNERKKN